MTGYRHRRLRRGTTRHPAYVLTVDWPGLTREQAEQIRRAWREAATGGPLIVSRNVTVQRLR